MDTHGMIDKVNGVEIHGDDLILSVPPFQPDGNNVLFAFLENTLNFRTGTHFIEHVLSQLLCNGTSTSFFSQGDNRSYRCSEINSGMAVESFIFCCNECIDDVFRQILKVYVCSVINVVFSDNHSIR